MKYWLFSFLFIVGGILLGVFAWRVYQVTEITIDWSTASEMDIAGFNIYRGTSSTGPFERINPVLILAASDPLVGADYTYKDLGVRAGKIYYYNLEEIKLDSTASIQGQIAVAARHGGFWEGLAAVLLLFAGILIHHFPQTKTNE